MTRIVLDASVALALVREEPWSGRIRAQMARWSREGAELLVPSHFWLEITNSLGRRLGWSSARIFEALRELDELRLQTVEADRPLVLLAIARMERWGLSSYDAAYLALADVVGAGVATQDRRLLAAAGPSGIDPTAEPDGSGTRLSEVAAAYGRAEPRPVTWPQWRDAGSYLGSLRRRALEEGMTARPAVRTGG